MYSLSSITAEIISMFDKVFVVVIFTYVASEMLSVDNTIPTMKQTQKVILYIFNFLGEVCFVFGCSFFFFLNFYVKK